MGPRHLRPQDHLWKSRIHRRAARRRSRTTTAACSSTPAQGRARRPPGARRRARGDAGDRSAPRARPRPRRRRPRPRGTTAAARARRSSTCIRALNCVRGAGGEARSSCCSRCWARPAGLSWARRRAPPHTGTGAIFFSLPKRHRAELRHHARDARRRASHPRAWQSSCSAGPRSLHAARDARTLPCTWATSGAPRLTAGALSACR